MTSYKRITRKKETKQQLLESPSDKIRGWVDENSQNILFAIGGLLVAGLIAYGVVYYQQVTFADAQARLYEAVAQAPAENVNTVQARDTQLALEDVINAGGSDSVVIQARLNLASLHMRQKDYKSAIEQYNLAEGEADKGSIFKELAITGKAYAMTLAGRTDEAVTQFTQIAKTANLYPKADALMALVYTRIQSGDRAAAIETINEIAEDYPDYMTELQAERIIKRIESGALRDALEKHKNTPETAPAEPDGKTTPDPGRIDVGNVHQGSN